MRTTCLVALAMALALPATAIADRGHSGRSTPSATKVAKTLKAKHRRAKTTIRIRIARPRAVALDDEREVTGRIASLAPLTVGALTCVVPAGVSLTGFTVGDVVELTCDRVGGQFVLRKIQLEDEDEIDEREVRGRIASLAPLTVGALTCVVPAGVSLTGFTVGDLVEMTCDLVQGQFVLRKIRLEDEDDEARGDDSNRGPGAGDADAHDHSGPGHGGDDDHSGHGGGGDD